MGSPGNQAWRKLLELTRCLQVHFCVVFSIPATKSFISYFFCLSVSFPIFDLTLLAFQNIIWCDVQSPPAFHYLPPLSFLSWNMTFYKWRTSVYPQCCLFIRRMNFIFRNFTRLSLSYVISILVFPSLYKMTVHHIPDCFISVLLSDILSPNQTLASLRGGGNTQYTQENLPQADNGSPMGGVRM